jgi:transcriptional regulator with XRE-family HTH domain
MYQKKKVPSRKKIQVGMNLRNKILRACAKNSHLTQKEIAVRSGIHPVTLSKIIHGKGGSTKTITKIAEIIGADAGRILTVGIKKPKYSIRSLDEVLNDTRIFNQFIGGTDDRGLTWAWKRFNDTLREVQKHNRKLQSNY